MDDRPVVAPEDRFVLRSSGTWRHYVYDRALDCEVGSAWLTWESASREAQRLNREARAAAKPKAQTTPPAPCPDCARYRAALEWISGNSGEVHTLRRANEEIDGQTGGGDAV